MSAITIRDMLGEDIASVCSVDQLCITPPWSYEAFRSEIQSPVSYYRVAATETEVVGYIGSHIILDEAHITTFGVRPDLRRQYIGERLIADVLRQAMQCGCRRVTLEVRETNVGAQRLYRKYGFSPVSRRRAYYTDNGEDALVMWIDDMTRMGFLTLFDERTAALAKRLGKAE